jgi:hypothetical protein
VSVFAVIFPPITTQSKTIASGPSPEAERLEIVLPRHHSRNPKRADARLYA